MVFRLWGVGVLAWVASAAALPEDGTLNAIQASSPAAPKIETGKSYVMEYLYNSTAAKPVACPIDEIVIETIVPPANVTDFLNVEQLKNMIGGIKDLKWVRTHESTFGDLDGRNEDKIIATPGGDLGEFIIAMAAYETEQGITMDLPTVTGVLMKYLATTAAPSFTMATSEEAHKNLTCFMDCPSMDISDPKESKKALLRKAVINATHVGSVHLKAMLDTPADYGLRKGIAELGIGAFHEVMWNKSFPLSDKLSYIMLGGKGREKAFVSITEPVYCRAQGLTIAVQPTSCCQPRPLSGYPPDCKTMSFYVAHTSAAAGLRRELAEFLARGDTALANKLVDAMNKIAATGLAKTATSLLNGYPYYNVKLKQKENAAQQQ